MKRILREFELSSIAAVDRPCQEGATVAIMKRDNSLDKREFSSKQREKGAEQGWAKPDGSYPIRNANDLRNAIRAWGRGGATASDKAWIKQRARALGATDQLPEDWQVSKIADRIIKQLSCDDFDAALEKVLDSARECDAAEPLIEMLKQLDANDAIDEGELTEQLSKMEEDYPDLSSQLHAALAVSDRLEKLRKRITRLQKIATHVKAA